MTMHRIKWLARLRCLSAIAIALVTMIGCWPGNALALTEVTDFGSNPGALRMYTYVASSAGPRPGLVVLLHGCSQRAANYDDETGWVELAERWGLLLLLPEQQLSNNGSYCFNWFEAGDIERDSGEALSIKQMIDHVVASHDVDSGRVYITGLSAGAAMTAVMLAVYPELFAGGAIIAGVPYRCGVGVTAAFGCMSPGRDQTPEAWGDLVRGATTHTGPWPRISIWHGDQDYTVAPLNGEEGIEQWLDVHGLSGAPDVSDVVDGQAHRAWRGTGSRSLVEAYTIAGMGHGTPVAPGAAEPCGQAGAFVLDVGICAALRSAMFWGLSSSPSDAGQVDVQADDGRTSDAGPMDLVARDLVQADRIAQQPDSTSTDAATEEPAPGCGCAARARRHAKGWMGLEWVLLAGLGLRRRQDAGRSQLTLKT